VKMSVPAGTLVKSKGSKTLASKATSKVNKVLVYTFYIIGPGPLINLPVSHYNITVRLCNKYIEYYRIE